MLLYRQFHRSLGPACIVALALATPLPALAQEKPAEAPPAKAPAWGSQCTSSSRTTALECSMEQRLVLEGSGQFLSRLVIKQHTPGQQPVMMLHVPLGVSLPAGLRLSVDNGTVGFQLAYQTCDGAGCYAAEQIAEPVLAALKRGKELSLHFENSAKRPIDLKFSLMGFSAAYDAIN